MFAGAAIAKSPPPLLPTGELVLDMADPILSVIVNGVPLRLRVGLEQKDAIELNPASAERLGVRFEPDIDVNIGRITLPSRIATAPVEIQGRVIVLPLASH